MGVSFAADSAWGWVFGCDSPWGLKEEEGGREGETETESDGEKKRGRDRARSQPYSSTGLNVTRVYAERT